MSTRISHIPFFGRLYISDTKLFAAAAMYALPLVTLFMWRPKLGIFFAAVPVCLLLVSHGPSAIAVLIGATFVYAPLTDKIVLLPADAAAMILIAAYIVDLLFRGPAKGVNRLAGPYLLYLAVMLISVSLEGFTFLSVRFFLRQLLLAGAFMAISHYGHKINPRNILIVFVVVAVMNSTYSLAQFLLAGGTIRAFGLAGRGYGDHAMLAFLISSVFYIWTRDVRARILWGLAAILTFGALVATQTRASMITAGWGLVMIAIFALWAGRRHKINTPAKNLAVAVGLMLLIIPVLAAYTPMFEGIAYRFGRIGLQASETILLRISLWKAATAAFWGNPFFGIGAGNFPMVAQWVPEVRFDYIFYLVAGLSTHSVLMTVLAEMGLAGLLSLVLFFGRSLKMAHREFSSTAIDNDLPVTHSLFAVSLAIIGSSFYAGSWFWGSNSYHMALFFGVIASYRQRLTQNVSGGGAA